MDFYFRIIMDMVYYAMNISFYRLIFLHTPTLGGWNEDQALIFVGGYLFIDGLIMTFVSNNLWWLPIYVNQGDLDYYLIRPVSPLFVLSLRDFSLNSFINLLMTVGIFGWTLWRYPGSFTLLELLFYVILLILGAFLYYLVRILSVIPVFWTLSNRGLDFLVWQFSRFMERPDRIFQGTVRFLLVWVVPFGIMASFPARLFLENFDYRLLIHMTGVTVIFFIVTLLFWRIGLRNYSSASS